MEKEEFFMLGIIVSFLAIAVILILANPEKERDREYFKLKEKCHGEVVLVEHRDKNEIGFMCEGE